MVAMLNLTMINGKNILKLVKEGKIKEETLDKIVNRTKRAAEKILEKDQHFMLLLLQV